MFHGYDIIKNKTILCFVLFLVTIFLFPMDGSHAAIVDEELALVDSSKVSIAVGRAAFNRRTGEASQDVTVTNNSTESFAPPVYLSVEGITDPSVIVTNADDTNAAGTPFFILAAQGAEVFSPGAQLTAKVTFLNPSRVRFSFTNNVFVTVPPDILPPVINNIAPINGSTTPDAQPSISAIFSDDASGIDITSVKVTLDGNDITSQSTVTEASVTFTPATDLADGQHTVIFTVSDIAGNAGNEQTTFTISVPTPIPTTTPVITPIPTTTLTPTPIISPTPLPDIIPPNLSITRPFDGSLIIVNQPGIQVTFSDSSGVDNSSLAFTANGNPLDVNCQFGPLGGSCFPASALPEGDIALVAMVEDSQGNKSSTQIQFIVDSTSVVVSISSPLNGLITKENEIEVTGDVGDGITSVTVNGVAASFGSPFSAMVPLREGKNMIVAVAKKASGKTGSDSVDITRDIAPPVVRIASPRDGFVSVENSIAVTGQVNDIVSGAKDPVVTVNGISATVANGSFMVTDLPLVRGPNDIEVIATDAVGNVGRHSINVLFQEPVGSRLTLFSGNGQSGQVRDALPEPLVVMIKDSLGNPVASHMVRFEVIRNSGLLRTSEDDTAKRVVQAPTDGGGKASVLYTLGDTAGEGNNRVVATALGVVSEVEFCASGASAIPDKILMVGGDNQRGAVGNPLANPLETLVVDGDGNPAQGIPVTFTIIKGDGNLNGNQALELITGADGIARTVLTLGFNPGINNNVVNARFPGLTGLPASFIASALLPSNPADTRLSGVVLDNGQTSIPGAEISIGGTTINSTTDDQGQFLLNNVPVGKIVIDIDPTNSPRTETFPHLQFETVTVAGQNNTLGQPIMLPAIQTENSKVVGGNDDVVITMNRVPGLTLTVFANSATFPDGSKTGQLTISQVHLDKVPMPPPSGTIFMPPAWTIQPAGVLFNPPARITIPNDGLPPGRVIDIFQFDHALNEFINIGKGTVSADGFVITSDPGFGVTRAGWGGCGQPQPPTTDVAGNAADPGAAVAGEPGSVPNADNGEEGGDTDVTPQNDGSTGEDGTADPNGRGGDDSKKVGDGSESMEDDGANTGADPVILATGEFIQTEVDLAIPGRGFSFEVRRTYRSKFNFNGLLGNNWDMTYNERLVLPDPGDADQSIGRCSGRSRVDNYKINTDDSYTSPDGFYDRLTKNPDETFTIRNRHGFRTNFDAQGQLSSLVDRNNNTMTFSYDAQGHLETVTDTLGRDIDFIFNDKGRLVTIRDFFGREVKYTYDGRGDLVSVRSPVVTDTSTGNDFPGGKTTRYEYFFDERNASLLAGLNSQESFLDHNLIAITDPKGQRYLVNSYGEIPGTYEFDRIVRQQFGDADQVYDLSYTALNPDATNITPDLQRNQTVEIDRNGNRTVYIHNELGNLLEKRLETNRDVNPDDPDTFVTRHTYNADGERLMTIFPEGNRIDYAYDANNPERFQQGNLIENTYTPGSRGGDQTTIRTSRVFEPVYNRIFSKTGTRGNDPGFIPQNGGANSPARYTMTYSFDYQEGANLALLAAEMGIGEAEVGTLLANAGISFNFGDQNGDGVTNRINGNIVRRDDPTVRLLANSAQAVIEEDITQELIRTYTYNRFGQKISATDQEGNVDDYLYHPENDPDGDNTVTVSLRSLAADTGGYLSAVIYDNRTSARRRSTAPLTKIRNELFYDPVGNIIRSIDGRGNPTRYERNALNQVVRQILEPPFNYEHAYIYDANNNVIREEIQNRDTNGPDLDEFVTYTNDYNTLDNRITGAREVSTKEVLMTQFGYDKNENLTRLIQPEGNVVENVYDERDLIFTVTRGAGSPEASTRTMTYDGNKNLIRVVDAADNNGDDKNEETLYFYDGYDRSVRTKDAVGNEMSYNYDPASNMVVEQHFGLNGGVSPKNNTGTGNVLLAKQEMLFDELSREFEGNNLLFSNIANVGPEGALTSGDGKVTMRYEYDRNSRRTRALDDNIHQRLFEFDGVDRLIREIDELNNEVKYAYDDNNNITETIEIERSPETTVPDEIFTTKQELDSIDRRTVLIDNLGNRTQYSYDSRNNQTTTVDQMGNTMTYQYDGINRRLADISDLRIGGTGAGNLDKSNTANSDGQISKLYDWDKNSRLVSLTDDNGNVTRYAYDALNRRVQDTFADTTVNRYVYDRDDNLVAFTDENKSVTTNLFDGINRLLGRDVVRGAGVNGTTRQRFEYDGLSRRTKTTDNNDPVSTEDDSVVGMQYDSLSRLLVEVQNGKRIATVFDGVGNRLSCTYPDGRVVETGYDGLDRIEMIKNKGAAAFIAQYDYLGSYRTLERRYGNGTRLLYHNRANQDIGYDGNKRVVAHRHEKTAGALFAGFNYAYDKEDNRRFELDLFHDLVDAYEYDSVYRLTHTEFRAPVASVAGITNNNNTNADVAGIAGTSETAYRLDGVGNWRIRSGDGGSRVFTANVMNEYEGINGVAQKHDDNGNLTTDGSRKYLYDFANRLRVITDNTDNDIANYTYDALNRRISKDSGGDVARFFYDGARSIEERDGTDTLTNQYVFGRGIDEILELKNGGQFFYHENSIGSVVALTDSAGAVVERYRYDDYGVTTVLSADGLTPLSESSVGNPFGFTGRRIDNETGVYYYRARYYDSVRGRFFRRDPMGYIDGMGLYVYVGNNPVNFVDPFGEEKKDSEKTEEEFLEDLTNDFQKIRDEMTENGLRNPDSGSLGNLEIVGEAYGKGLLNLLPGDDYDITEILPLGCLDQSSHLANELRDEGYEDVKPKRETVPFTDITKHWTVEVTSPAGTTYELDTWAGSFEQMLGSEDISAD